MIFKKETIERKKRMVTSKERKKNSVYIYPVYTTRFPNFLVLFSNSAINSIPPPPPLSIYSKAPEGAKRESSQTIHRGCNYRKSQLDRCNQPVQKLFLLRDVYILCGKKKTRKRKQAWEEGRKKRKNRERKIISRVLDSFQCNPFEEAPDSNSNFSGIETTNSTLTRPVVFVDLFRHSPPSNPNGNETAPSMPAHATARPIHRGWKQARKSSSTNVEPRCHNGHIAN